MPAKGSKEGFEIKGRARYGIRFDYSGFIYLGSQKSGDIRCIEHDIIFQQTPSNHLKGYVGCYKCPGPKGVKRRIDVEDLIIRSGVKHNHIYDYSNVGNPKNTKSDILIKCTICNENFTTTFDSHLYHGTGCICVATLNKSQSNYVKEKVSTTYNLVALFPEIAEDWSITNDTAPEDYAPFSHKKVFWKCDKNHEYEMTIAHRTKSKQTCPFCQNRKLHDDNCLLTIPDAVKYWHYTKNTKDISQYTKGSGDTVWFICDCDIQHEYQMRICNFLKGERCPYKAGKSINFENSVASIDQLLNEWDGDNIDEPDEVAIGSGKIYSWKCEKEHKWKTSPNARQRKGSVITGCPQCSPIGYSRVSIEWLNYIELTEGIKIQHAESGGEYKIPETNYRADGYCKETNTIYEFHGSFYHGDPRIYNADEYCSFAKKTYGELYQKTLVKEQKIRELGYNLVVIWELDWNNKK
ncbi:Probable Zinc-ribbon domain-containing protein [Pacmanvirus A23]|uniref:Probable Zinc-ribbon domain-containing protein n=1 Tax=Pacmanvirus A23 TaxID=1932881 RepID=UPI000A09503B|nr:Probable Zinc-ribbon domain-containing protein [Pacmanvirus A23]SIP85930.1 Probable Zinc-ribbon domain-containing protein [Pacmanvirus A23]